MVFVSKQENRHGNPDGLGDGDGQRQNIAPTGHEGEDTAVIFMGELEPPIGFGYFHGKGPELEQAF